MAPRTAPVPLLLFTLGGVACGGGSAKDSGTSASEPTIQLATSSCNGTYAWQPRSAVGGVVASEPLPDFSLDTTAIAGLMVVAGAEDTSVVKHDVVMHRVRYVTQDRGQLVEATALVAAPDAPGETFDSLLYLHPTTGFEDFCAPSGRDLIWAGVPIVMASMGFVVAAPDYLGQNGFGDEAEGWHPYLVGEPTAVASLDSLRATWTLAADGTLGVSANDTTVIMGASQGGGAAFWAERYASEYLPEADVVGSVASVPAMDVLTWATLGAQELSVASVGIPGMLESMRRWYGLDNDLSELAAADEIDRLIE